MDTTAADLEQQIQKLNIDSSEKFQEQDNILIFFIKMQLCDKKLRNKIIHDGLEKNKNLINIIQEEVELDDYNTIMKHNVQIEDEHKEAAFVIRYFEYIRESFYNELPFKPPHVESIYIWAKNLDSSKINNWASVIGKCLGDEPLQESKMKNQLRNLLVYPSNSVDGPCVQWNKFIERLPHYKLQKILNSRENYNTCKNSALELIRKTLKDDFDAFEQLFLYFENEKVVGLENIGQLLHMLNSTYFKIRESDLQSSVLRVQKLLKDSSCIHFVKEIFSNLLLQNTLPHPDIGTISKHYFGKLFRKYIARALNPIRVQFIEPSEFKPNIQVLLHPFE